MVGLVLASSNSTSRDRFSIAAAALDVVAAIILVVLIHLEHTKSVRPSFLVSFYLSATLLLDVIRVRTAWLLPASKSLAGCLSASIAVKLILQALESIQKRRWLLPNEKYVSVESTSGPFNRGLFLWLNGMLRDGYNTLLAPTSLPRIHEKLESEKLLERFDRAWRSCGYMVSREQDQ